MNGNLAYAAGLMLLMMGLTAVYMPFALSIALQDAQVDPWQIAQPLLTLMLIPLAIGLLIRARYEAIAAALQPKMRQISNSTNFDDPAVISVIMVTSLSLFVGIRLIAKQAFAAGAEAEPLEVA